MDKTLKLHSNDESSALYGSLDENLRLAEKEYNVRISARNFRLKISGNKSNVEEAYRHFVKRLKEIREGAPEERGFTERSAALSGKEAGGTAGIQFFHRGKIIRAKTKNQEKYLEQIRDNPIVFSIGPAGTGKTYLAMAAAIDYLKKKRVAKIILTRPAVEAGESLGFLPGDLYAKVDPYLRPLYDALYDMMEFEEATRFLERGTIEVAPLAYMRGRTLNDSFVVLDEAQNCIVITGDITQIDLPGGKKSGLVEVQGILRNIEGISFSYLDETDVVRHPLVQHIIKAYEKFEVKST
ncbi:MAG: PhoH family protein [Candidatus Omnitrophica bacterium]|nr:PhoH family protein [Candidatus Omnitrophota bacterium]